MSHTGSDASSSAGPASNGAPSVKKSKPSWKRKKGDPPPIVHVISGLPKSKAPPPSGCKNPQCARVNKWSWQLEAENDRLREMLMNQLHENETKQLTQTFDSGTHSVIEGLKARVESKTAELSKLHEKHSRVVTERDEMSKTLLQLHQEYSKLKKNFKELTKEHLGLRTRYNVLAAGQGDQLAEELAIPNPPAYTHTGTYGPTPLAQVLAHRDETPTRLLRQLGPDVLEHASGLNAEEMAWSCCLQTNQTAGCTIPSPSHLDDLARKRREAKAKEKRRRSRGYRPKSRSGRVRIVRRNVPTTGSIASSRHTSSVSMLRGSQSMSALSVPTSDAAAALRSQRPATTTPGWRHNSTPSMQAARSHSRVFAL